MHNSTQPPSPPDNWKKKAALFLISQNVSLFGSSVVGFAIIWHITLETTSGFWMMLATMTFNLPFVIISLWGGVWADRYNRKLLIMLADAFVALATLIVAVAFWSGYKSLELLLLASTFRSIGGGVQLPAVNALYPQLVPAEQLARVQGINQTLSAILMLLSPMAGGLILGLVGLELAFMVDVVTAVAAIVILGAIKIPAAAPGAVESTFSEMRQGLSYVFSHRQLRLMLLCTAAFFFLVTPAGVLTPLMVARSFGPEVWRLTANEVVWSGASIIGGIFVARHGDFQNKPKVLALCMVAFGLCFGLMGLAWNFVAYLTLMGAAGFFMPIFTTAETVFIQQTADPAKLGRVFSINNIMAAGSVPISITFFGPLSDIVSVEWLLIGSGLLMAMVGGWYRKAADTKNPPSS
ncbi:MFS transporter [Deltaproteobacteria bacterium Smac51]|nr:MFS transporter [Deltaproteobacteria bacterium Smac51]